MSSVVCCKIKADNYRDVQIHNSIIHNNTFLFRCPHKSSVVCLAIVV